MADQAIVQKTTHRLAEAELVALRAHAAEMLLNYASERMPCFPTDGDREVRTDLTVNRTGSDLMMAAAEIYAPLKAASIAFSTAKGLPKPAESVVVAFTDRAEEWLRSERSGFRGMLEDSRGTVEIAEYGECHGTSHDTFLLWILDGILGEQEVI